MYRPNKQTREEAQKYIEKPLTKYNDNKYIERQRSLEKEKYPNNKFVERQRSLEKEKFTRNYDRDGRPGSVEKGEKYGENR